jgi:hypothetical protein
MLLKLIKKILARFMHRVIFFLGGLIAWFRLGVPFGDAMDSAHKAEEITWEEDV